MSADIRVEIRALAEQATALHMKERKITLESVYIVEKLEHCNASGTLQMKPEEFAKFIGLSANMYWMRLRVARVLRAFPALLKLYEDGETEISHLSMLLNTLTPANESIIIDGIRGKTKREVESFLSRVSAKGHVSADQGVTEITLRLTDDQRKNFDRAREVLAHSGQVPTQIETLLKGVELIMKAYDPMQKAERSAARAKKKQQDQTETKSDANVQDDSEMNTNTNTNMKPHQNPFIRAVEVEALENTANHKQTLNLHPMACSHKIESESAAQESNTQQSISKTYIRKPIPASVRHRVWLRDGGTCTFTRSDGNRCDEQWMLELDHIQMVCRGGTNDVENLRLRCRYHNRMQAVQELGESFRHRHD